MSAVHSRTGVYEPQRPVERAYVDVRGLTYCVHRWPGSGPRLVLLHGWMDTGASYQFLVDALPGHWDIYAPDWRGFGDSAWQSGSYYFPDYLADLDALLRHFSPDRPVVLAGHSLGGNVAGLYSGVRPERIARLVLIEGFGLPETQPEQAVKRYRDWLDALDHTPGLQHFEDHEALAAHIQRRNPHLSLERARFMARCWSRLDEAGLLELKGDPRHKLPNPVLYRLEEAMACWRSIEAPTLWIAGAESRIRDWFSTEEFARRQACFRDLRTVDIPEAGHGVQHEQPEALAEALRDFVA